MAPILQCNIGRSEVCSGNLHVILGNNLIAELK